MKHHVEPTNYSVGVGGSLYWERARHVASSMPTEFQRLMLEDPLIQHEISAYCRNPEDTLELALARIVVRLAADAKELRAGYIELLRRYPSGEKWVDTGE